MRYVVSPKNRGLGLPVLSTVVAWLTADRLNPSGWVWGVAGTIVAIIWIFSIICLFTDRDVDITEFLKTEHTRRNVNLK